MFSLKPEDDSLAVRLLKDHPELAQIGNPGESGIVHRLDNNTSGLVVAARDQKTYDKLRSAWNTDAVTKTYLALVLGAIPETIKLINRPIAHHPRKKNKMVVCRSEEEKIKWKGRDAMTRFVSKEFYLDKSGNAFTLLSLRIETGARHQIRVHLAGEGYPLVGDGLYQNAKQAAKDTVSLKGHFLHLKRIQVDKNVVGVSFDWNEPIDQSFLDILKNLRGPYPSSS